MAWNKKNGPAPQERPIETLTYDALIDLKQRVDTEVTKRSATELETLKDRLSTIAYSQGITLAEMFGVKARKATKKKRSVSVKYRNPDDPTQTWSGLGKPKRWLQEKLDAGASLEDFAVAEETT